MRCLIHLHLGEGANQPLLELEERLPPGVLIWLAVIVVRLGRDLLYIGYQHLQCACIE